MIRFDLNMKYYHHSTAMEGRLDHPILTTRPLQPNNAKPRRTRNPFWTDQQESGTSCLKPWEATTLA